MRRVHPEGHQIMTKKVALASEKVSDWRSKWQRYAIGLERRHGRKVDECASTDNHGVPQFELNFFPGKSPFYPIRNPGKSEVHHLASPAFWLDMDLEREQAFCRVQPLIVPCFVAISHIINPTGCQSYPKPLAYLGRSIWLIGQ